MSPDSGQKTPRMVFPGEYYYFAVCGVLMRWLAREHVEKCLKELSGILPEKERGKVGCQLDVFDVNR